MKDCRECLQKLKVKSEQQVYLNDRRGGILCKSQQDADAGTQVVTGTHSTYVAMKTPESQRMSGPRNSITG